MLLFSPTVHTDNLIKNTRIRPQERVDCKITRPLETFMLNVPLKPEEKERVLLLTSLQVFLSVVKKVLGKTYKLLEHQILPKTLKKLKTNSDFIQQCEEIIIQAVERENFENQFRYYT